MAQSTDSGWPVRKTMDIYEVTELIIESLNERRLYEKAWECMSDKDREEIREKIADIIEEY